MFKVTSVSISPLLSLNENTDSNFEETSYVFGWNGFRHYLSNRRYFNFSISVEDQKKIVTRGTNLNSINYLLISFWKCNQNNQYFYSATYDSCRICPFFILGCVNCINISLCNKCNHDAYFVEFQDHCVCKDGYYLNGTTCLKCQASCLTCVDSSTFCLTCNTSNLRYFIENRCDCISIYSDCRNSSLQNCNHSQCSYLTVAELELVKVIKDPLRNFMSITIKILSSINHQFDHFNYEQLIDFGLPEGTQIQYLYHDSQLNISISYYDNLQNYASKLTLNLSKVDLWYFELAPIAQLQYSISPNNNLASNFYSPDIYEQHSILRLVLKILLGVGFLVYLIGLFSSRLVSSQMLGTLQIAYLGLFIVNHSDPLIEPLNLFKYFNGFNDFMESARSGANDRLTSIGVTSLIFANLNLMLFLFLIPFVISSVFYLIHLKNVKLRLKMQKMWKIALGQYLFTTFLFTIYNFGSSLGVFCSSTFTSTWIFYASLIQILIYLGGLGTVFWIYISKDKIFMGEFRSLFNWNLVSQFYYVIKMSLKLLIGVIFGLGNSHFISGILVLVLLLSDGVFVLKVKPYVEPYHNIRSWIHSFISFLIVVVYVVLSVNGASKEQGIFTYFPYIVFGLISLNIIIGLIFIIKQFLFKLKKRNNKIEQNKIEQMFNEMNVKLYDQAVKILEKSKKYKRRQSTKDGTISVRDL